MGTINPAYNLHDRTIILSGKSIAVKESDTLDELRASKAFDRTMCIGYCDNHPVLNKYFKSVGNSNNFDFTGNRVGTDTTIVFKEDFNYSDVKFIGCVILDNNSTKHDYNSMYSEINGSDKYNGLTNYTGITNARIVTDIGGNGLNDIFVVTAGTTASEKFLLTGTDENERVYGAQHFVYYCPNLNNADSNTYIQDNSILIGLSPYFVVELIDDIIFIPMRTFFANFTYYNRWTDDNDFKIIINQGGTIQPRQGYWENDIDIWTYNFGMPDLTAEKTQWRLNPTDHSIGLYQSEDNAYNLNKRRMMRFKEFEYLMNMLGIKWLSEGTLSNAYDVMKLPYMDENGRIDCTRWYTGMPAILSSDSMLKDIDYDKLPDLITTRLYLGKDRIKKIYLGDRKVKKVYCGDLKIF